MDKSRLIIYDTTNFVDFPIGGQLTSVSNFLRFLCATHSERVANIVLVGVTKDSNLVGHLTELERFGCRFKFLPVTVVDTDLAHTAHSLRLSYAKGLIKYGRKLHIKADDCNYIQTPEAFGPVKMLNGRAACVIFSHGSYANMERGFRFFQKNKLVKNLFTKYLEYVITKADLIFVIDEASREDYCQFTSRLEKAGNSVVLPENYDSWKPHEYLGRLIFAGRLSKDKGIDGIIEATVRLNGKETLNIAGDGEERDNLESLVKINGAGGISFAGAVSPDKISEYMDDADILIMNSTFEGVPMTILEAFSHGLPVITTGVGGIPETVCFGKDAVRTSGDPDSIIRAVNVISSKYREFSINAHRHAADYSYLIVGGRIYDALSKFWK